MRLSLTRQKSTPNSTLGSLYIDGLWFSFTLEDIVRALGPNGEGKVAGRTAIPAGEYAVIIDKSTRFNRLMPHILNVPFFEGVRIHSGNTAADTEGCILLGLDKTGEDSIGHSVTAFEAFMDRLKAGLLDGEVKLTITEA
jgi:hypothetical protein